MTIYAVLKVPNTFAAEPESDVLYIPFDYIRGTRSDYSERITTGLADSLDRLAAHGEVICWRDESGSEFLSLDRISNPDAVPENQITVRAALAKYWGVNATEADVRPPVFGGLPWL